MVHSLTLVANVLYIQFLCHIHSQYTTIYYDNMESSTGWSMFPSSLKVHFGSDSTHCFTGTCCKLDAVAGTNAYIYRSYDTSSYGSLQLQFDIRRFTMRTIHNQERLSFSIMNQVFNLPNSESVSTLWIWFESNSLWSTDHDWCYVDNLYINAMAVLPTISPTKISTVVPTQTPTVALPTKIPTVLPTDEPSATRTQIPSSQTMNHTKRPTFDQSDESTTATNKDAEQEMDTTPKDNWLFYAGIAVVSIVVTAALFGGLYSWKSRENSIQNSDHNIDNMKVEMKIQPNIVNVYVVNRNENDWENWNSRDVVAWISSVENGKYRAYASVFVAQKN
eukprot:895392_1